MLAGRKADPVDTCPQGQTLKTRDEVARTVQLGSGRTYERGRQLFEELEAQPDRTRVGNRRRNY